MIVRGAVNTLGLSFLILTKKCVVGALVDRRNGRWKVGMLTLR